MKLIMLFTIAFLYLGTYCSAQEFVWKQDSTVSIEQDKFSVDPYYRPIGTIKMSNGSLVTAGTLQTGWSPQTGDTIVQYYVVLISDDDGKTWKKTFESKYRPLSLHKVNGNSLLLDQSVNNQTIPINGEVQYKSKFLLSNDNGHTWFPSQMLPCTDSITCVNPSRLTIHFNHGVGVFNSVGRTGKTLDCMYKTTNNGMSWDSVANTNAIAPGFTIKSLTVLTKNKLLGVLQSHYQNLEFAAEKLCFSADQGITWKDIGFPFDQYGGDSSNLRQTAGMQFVDSLVGFCLLTELPEKRTSIAKTTDGGLHWTVLDSNIKYGNILVPFNLTPVYFKAFSQERVVVVFQFSIVRATSDGGKTWNTLFDKGVPYTYRRYYQSDTSEVVTIFRSAAPEGLHFDDIDKGIMFQSDGVGQWKKYYMYRFSFDSTATTDIEKIESELQSVYVRSINPNPASSNVSLNVFIDPSVPTLELSLFDIFGTKYDKTVYLQGNYPLGWHNVSIPVHDIPSGFYMLQIKNSKHHHELPCFIVR